MDRSLHRPFQQLHMLLLHHRLARFNHCNSLGIPVLRPKFRLQSVIHGREVPKLDALGNER